MLLVKTKIGPSNIQGTGLFADEFIPKGTLVWKFDPSVDEAWTKEEAEQLPEPKRTQVLSLLHAYISSHTHLYTLCGDNAIYCNHSYEPNVIDLEPDGPVELNVAARDIQQGEELTVDYRKFEEGVDFEATA
jgi:uncharacterized protein